MDPAQHPKPYKKGTGPLGVCPYLGVQDDPATHFAWAKPGHFCYRVRPSQPIEPTHQENFCLNGKYPTCVVYPASWRGTLPSKIRDDAYMDWIQRAAVVRSSFTAGVTGQGVKAEEKNTSHFGMDLQTLREQADFVADEPVPSPWYGKLGGKKIVFGLMVFIMIVVVLLAAVLSIQSLFNATSASDGESSGASNITQTAAALGINIPSPTSNIMAIADLPTDTPVSTETQLPTPSRTPLPNTPTPTDMPQASATIDMTAVFAAIPTATPTPFNCQEEPSYTYEITSGPILAPEMGYIYSPITAPPVASAGWVIKNTGPCTWENVLLLSISTNRLLVPYIRQDGELIKDYTTRQTVSVTPGSEIEVGLSFPLSIAHSIRSEWALVINNFRLTDRPRLTLDVNNWVLGLNVRPTEPVITRPPGSRDKGGDEPPSVRP